MTYFRPVQIKNSGRPILSNDEHDIIINDSVGLYKNNQRIKDKQNGRIFLTNKRLIYVDNLSPLNSSVSLHLNDIDSIDYQSRFLKRSSRLIIFLIFNKNNQVHNQSNLPNLSSPSSSSSSYSSPNFTTEWICPICSATNISNGKITLNSTDFPICTNCGIQMVYNMTKDSVRYHINNTTPTTDINKKDNGLPCPKCTFLNHSSIKYCEMCDTKLPQIKKKLSSSSSSSYSSSSSPSSKDNNNNNVNVQSLDRPKYIQISFRKTDGFLFFEATKKALNDLKLNNGSFNQNLASVNGMPVTQKNTTPIPTPILTSNIEFMGINGLERYKETQLLNNDILFNNALQDLNKLMSLANSIENLYKSQNKNLLNTQTSNKNIIETNLIIDRDKFLNQDSFLNELSREIYDFAMLEFKDNEINNNVLIPLIDFYAMYNKAMRIGTGLISPQELKEACQRFPKLGLNDLRLITLNKRILCLATNDSFDFIKGQILELLSKNQGLDILKLTQLLNELADQNKSKVEDKTASNNNNNNQNSVWTVSIIEEILQSCINNGLLVIDEDLSGIYYYTNLF